MEQIVKVDYTEAQKNESAIFSRNLKYYLALTGKKQTDLAKDLGVSHQRVSSWLNAKALPRMAKIEAIAQYFNIEKSDLIQDKEKDSTQAVAKDEQEIIAAYRSASKDLKKAVRAVLGI